MQNNMQPKFIKKKRVLSKFGRFVRIAIFSMIALALIIAVIFLALDNMHSNKEIKAARERIENSPEMKKWRAEETKRKREMARRKRLRQMGVTETSAPTAKDDFLNTQLSEQARKQEESLAEENLPGYDYADKLATYNAKLQEVKNEQARLRAEAIAKAKAEAEAKRALKQKQMQNQNKVAKTANAKTARPTVKVPPKTEKKTLQTTKSSFGYNSFKTN